MNGTQNTESDLHEAVAVASKFAEALSVIHAGPIARTRYALEHFGVAEEDAAAQIDREALKNIAVDEGFPRR